MSHTDRQPPRNWYAKERGWARRQTRRLERHNAAAHIRHQRYDAADTRQVKPTQGWMTW